MSLETVMENYIAGYFEHVNGRRHHNDAEFEKFCEDVNWTDFVEEYFPEGFFFLNNVCYYVATRADMEVYALRKILNDMDETFGWTRYDKYIDYTGIAAKVLEAEEDAWLTDYDYVLGNEYYIFESEVYDD